MTDFQDTPDMVDDGVTDVLADDDVVHVPPAAAELAESAEHGGETFITDVEWDEPEQHAAS